ncbi:hypothetical protein WNY77_10435 [Paraglaciecola mesophila]|uniref:Uncharacterized protein n=1 Tax=Paraglaciecola mesophila TaxID=197222 RepID=A0ABU9SW45_9ALTE
MLPVKKRFSKTRLLKRSVALTFGLLAFGFCNSLQSDAYFPLNDTEHFALQGEYTNEQYAQQGLAQSYSGMFWHSL